MEKFKTKDESYEALRAGESRQQAGKACYYCFLPNGEYFERIAISDEAWNDEEIESILTEITE